MSDVFASDDFQEGIRAFLEKRRLNGHPFPTRGCGTLDLVVHIPWILLRG